VQPVRGRDDEQVDVAARAPQQLGGVGEDRDVGWAARARSARCGSEVVTAWSASPRVAEISGAWKTSPASP
jgi:hypothetical protein